MEKQFYKKMIEDAHYGYAYHKIILDDNGIPIDYEFIEVNKTFENLIGLKRKNILNKQITNIYPNLSNDKHNLIAFYGEIAINGKEKTFEYYSKALKKHYSVTVHSPEKYYFVTIYTDINEQKNKEEQLKETQTRHYTLFESAVDAIFLMKNDKFIDCNSKTLEMFGCKRDEIINHSPTEFSPNIQPNGNKSGKQAIEKINAAISGKPQLFEWQHNKLDGTLFCAEVSLKKIKLSGNIYIQAIVRNISKRKQAENKLIQKNEQLELVMEGANIGWWDWDIQSGKEIYNEILPELLEYKLNEIEPNINWWKDKIHPDDLKQDTIDLQEHFSGKTEFYRNKHRLKTKTGKWKWFLDHGKIIKRDKNGKPIRMIGILRDIDNQHKTEETLKESEEHFRALIENSNDVVSVIDYKGNSKYRSPAYEKLIGFKPDYITENVFEYIHPDDKERMILQFKEFLGKYDEVEKMSYRYLHKNGTWRYLEGTGKNMLNSSIINGIVLNYRDVTDHKKAELALKESEKNFRLLFENSPLGIFITNLDGVILEANKSLLKILNSPSLEATKQINILKFKPLIDNGFTDIFLKCVQTGEIIHDEKLYKSKWDKSSFVTFHLFPFIDKNGKVEKIYTVMENITERKEAEKELKESEAYNKTLFHSSNIPLIVMDSKTYKYTDCNNAAIKIYGFKNREEILGKTPLDVSTPIQYNGEQSSVLALEKINEAIKNDSTFFEWKHQKPNGEIWDGEVHLMKLKYKNKEILQFSLLDITERKKTEQKLKQQNEEYAALNEEFQVQNEELRNAIERAEKSEQQFTAVFEQAPLSIQIFNAEGLTLNVNKAWENLWQGSKEQVLNNYNILNDTYAESIGWLKYIRKAFKGEIVNLPDLEYDPTQTEHLGRKRILRCLAFPIKQNNVLNKVVLFHQDVTEIKKYELALIIAKEKAEESDHLKTEFINNMSHEIRTPMNGILGFSEFLSSPDLTEEKRKYYINIIQNSGAQLLRIIDDILEISKLGTKQVKLKHEKVCLNDLLLELFSIFDIKAKENKTPLFFKKGLSDEDSTIFTDKTKLNKVLSNLLENSLKFTNSGFIEFGYSIIETQSTTPQLEIYIKDTGIGINPQKQKMIFERFSQEEKGLTRNIGGLGLGLSIAKENTELLGGEITVISKKGKGAIFYVRIPYNPVNLNIKISKADSNKNIIVNNQDKYTFLIAEDEEVNYLYIETLIYNIFSNSEILHAKNGQEAIDICKANSNISLILMDIKMPIMNGYEATKQIKKFRPNLPIVAQTAYSTLEDKNKSISAGCEAFISKPIKKEILNEIIAKYLVAK